MTGGELVGSSGLHRSGRAATGRQNEDATTPGNHRDQGRLQGVDAFRTIFVLWVVVLHALPGDPALSGAPAWVVVAATLSRPAVPFFFVASGYFLKPPARPSIRLISRPLQRLLPVHLGWLAIYYALATGLGLASWHFRAMDLLDGGAAYHLWFLPALGVALVVVGCGIPVAGRAGTLGVCILLAAVGLARGGYHDVLGLSGTSHRGGLLVAPLFVFIGTSLARRHVRLSVSRAVAVFVGAVALLVLEELIVARLTGHNVVSHDFMLATFPLGAAGLVLATSDVSDSPVSALAPLGRLSLGAYASHLLFLWAAGALFPPGPGSWIAGVLFAMAGATLLSLALVRLPVMRRLVT